MGKKYEKLEIKKDQLLPEDGFVHFCNNDPANIYGSGKMQISGQFLMAAEKDNIIKPIFRAEEKVKKSDGDGVEKVQTVSYYSPHQIYLLAELRENKVDENGYLWGGEEAIGWRYSNGSDDPQKLRMLAWGQGRLVNPEAIDSQFDDNWFSILQLSKNLHSFLELLHGLNTKPRHLIREQKWRYWNNAPTLDYDFGPIETGGDKLLKVYELDTNKLNKLRKHIGQFAEIIDPLAYWHYYIEKHPEYKKDLLKGDALLAQEIYRLYNLITEIWEIVAKKKAEPIFELLHKDFGVPFHIPKIEYLEGEDIKALRYATQQFEKWKLEKDNKPFASNEIIKKFNAVKQEIDNYEKKYGDRFYAGSIREICEEGNIKLEDLDEKTKWYVNNALSQIKDANIKEEIADAIASRLRDLQQELKQIFRDVGKQFRDKKNVAWEEINGNNLWKKLAMTGKFENLDRTQQIKLVSEESDRIKKEAKSWQEKANDFHGQVSWYANLVFCKACRERPVQLHKENSDRNYWNSFMSCICDNCLKTKRLRTMPVGEYRCDNCGNLLSKFINSNIINDLIFRQTSEMRIELEYGKIRVEIQCNGYQQCPDCKGIMFVNQSSRCKKHEECKKPYVKSIEWGWLP